MKFKLIFTNKGHMVYLIPQTEEEARVLGLINDTANWQAHAEFEGHSSYRKLKSLMLAPDKSLKVSE